MLQKCAENRIGELTELFIPVSGFLVHPFVGWSNSQLLFNPDENEVEYLIVFPLRELLSLNISETYFTNDGKRNKIPFYNIKNEMIWGATSMILSEFIEVLRRTESQ